MFKKHKVNKNELTVGGHYRELKHRLFICLLVFVSCFAISYYFKDLVLGYVTEFGTKYGYTFITLSPQEILIETLRVCSIISMLCAVPVVALQILLFIAPVWESKIVTFKLFFLQLVSLGFFVLGATFCIKILIPFALSYLQGYSIVSEIKVQVTLSNFVSFVSMVTIYMGLIFEMPVLCGIFAKLKLLDCKTLLKFRNAIIIAVFIIAAVITPPDVISQIIVAVPMLVLYLISIIVVRILN